MKNILLVIAFALVGCASPVQAYQGGYVSTSNKYQIQFGHPQGEWAIVAGSHSYFMTQDGKPITHFIGSGSGPWGSGSSMVGAKIAPLPYAMKIRWFSVIENQFWEGEYQFDQKRLHQLFERKYRNVLFQKEVTGHRSNFVINVLPTGLVTVWLTTSSEQHLLGQFQAQKTDMDWTEFIAARGPLWKGYTREQWLAEIYNSNRNASLRQSLAQMKRNNGVFDISPWIRRMKKYPWHLEVSAPFILKDYLFDYTNGEAYYTYADTSVVKDALQPMPQRAFIYIERPDKTLKRLNIRFDEENVMAAFEKLGGKSEQESMVMLLELAEDLGEGEVYLRNRTDKIKLNTQISLEDLYLKS